MKKRIAIFANTSWNIYNFRLDLIESLKDNNFEVIIIIPDNEYIHKIRTKVKNVEIVSLNHLKRESVNPWYDIKLVFELRKVIKDQKIDIVVSYTIKPNIYINFAVLFTPTVTLNTVTGLGYIFLKNNFVSYLAKKLYKIAFLRSTTVIFQNTDDRDLFVKQKIVDKHKTTIIFGSGINTKIFVPKEQQHKSESLNFLFVGRILKDKGIVELIEASKVVLKRHPLAMVNIVGGIDTNLSNISAIELANMIQGYPNIQYQGHCENVLKWLYGSDVIVLPSYREGLPKAILEALSVGKPVIVTDTAGCRDTVVHGHNGYSVEVRSVDSLAEAMSNIIDLPAESRKKMGNASRQMAVEKFDDKIVIKSYLKIIQNI